MPDPGFTDEEPTPGQWYEKCTCGHSWLHHDVDDLEGSRPSCCYSTCPCGPGSYFEAAGDDYQPLPPCARCGHPASWHRHDDTSTPEVDGHNSHGQIAGEERECPFRCIGYDCEAPDAWGTDEVCGCPDYQGAA